MQNNPLTDPDTKADTIWQKIREKAKLLGFGKYDCSITIHGGEIVEFDLIRELSKIRAD